MTQPEEFFLQNLQIILTSDNDQNEERKKEKKRKKERKRGTV